jgi:hypothetical protein
MAVTALQQNAVDLQIPRYRTATAASSLQIVW